MNKKSLYNFFSGKASPEDIHIVRQWVESSEENKNTFFKERKLFDAIALCNQTTTDIKEDESYFSLGFREFIKIAAIVLVTFGISFFYFKIYNQSQDSPMTVISVPAGQRVNMTLPDGTNVWLNALTTFRYPTSFSKEKRQVFIDGEGYFDVTKNEKRPFFVETGSYQIEVLGTSFNVDAYSKNKMFETALMKGLLRVRSNDPSKAGYTELHPNTKAVLKGDGKLYKESITDFNAYKWVDGLISFKDQPFEQIMKEFEKCYDIIIIVNNKNVNEVVYTGKFSYSDGVDYALKVLQKNIRFNYKRDDKKRIIYIN